MTEMQVLAAASTVLGCTGVVSMLAYRAALRCVDIDVLPDRILPRAIWWRDHAGPVLRASLFLVIAGLVGLVAG